jgi:hypothetical protein
MSHVNDHILSADEMNRYGETATFKQQVFAMWAHQMENLEQARINFGNLSFTEVKRFNAVNGTLMAQYNPGRMLSTTAKTDKQSIESRPCFLCPHSLYSGQKGVLFKDKYLVLVNPFPIFRHHFTIPLIEHRPQELAPYFGDMLLLAAALPALTLLYNGAKCGASAPDHFHFQAVAAGNMPFEKESLAMFDELTIFDNSSIAVAALHNLYRNGYLMRSSSISAIVSAFTTLMEVLPSESGDEPMMNVLVNHVDDTWNVWVFPREKHRPACYYATDDSQLLFSPGSVDFGGISILPRKEDFDKVTFEMITGAFNEVMRNNSDFEAETTVFAERLKTIST